MEDFAWGHRIARRLWPFEVCNYDYEVGVRVNSSFVDQDHCRIEFFNRTKIIATAECGGDRPKQIER